VKFVKSINASLDKLLETHSEVILYGEDLLDPYGGAFKVSKGLSTKHPKQVLSTPISEAAIVGMAGGMAIAGLRPIVEIMFGDFLTLTIDQIMNHLTKYNWMYNGRVTVPVTIRAAMGGGRGYGPTHSQSLEPLLASIPMLKIVSPSIYHNPGQLLEITVLDDDVKIFVEAKQLYARDIRFEDDPPEGISIRSTEGKYPTVSISNCEFEEPELLIISHGGSSTLVEEIMQELLFEYEFPVECVLPALIKPAPIQEMESGVRRAKTVLFIEESPKENGWSNEIIASLAELNLIADKDIMRFGSKSTPIPSSMSLESQILPDKKNIISSIVGKFNL
jgi:pyruvate/2-oxoglutarate/acetoin dehydrogenase E1 component